LKTLVAGGGYQGPQFAKAIANVLPTAEPEEWHPEHPSVKLATNSGHCAGSSGKARRRRLSSSASGIPRPALPMIERQPAPRASTSRRTRTCSATPVDTPSPTRATTLGRLAPNRFKDLSRRAWTPKNSRRSAARAVHSPVAHKAETAFPATVQTMAVPAGVRR
jgi:hypothetical protein